MSIKDAIAQKLATIAANSPRVYAAGETKGVEEGKQAEYDAFWDAYQQNGARRAYENAFGGNGWTAQTLKPKFNIVVEGSMASLFQYCAFEGDLAQHFEDLGISFNTSGATSAHNLFGNATKVTRIPAVDISKCAAASTALFTNDYELVTIDELTIASNNSFSGAFTSCRDIVNLKINGTAGLTSIDLHWSKKLSKASIESVIDALSSTTTGLTLTLSIAAVQSAFETSEGANDGNTSAEWTALVATKTNWTISLV